MQILDENIVSEAQKLIESGRIMPYINEVWKGWTDWDTVAKRTGFDIRTDKVTDLESAKRFAKWCHHLWETLPDKPWIRHGPFFQICDFAEYHCQG